MVWYSQYLKNFPQFVVIHTVKGFGVVNKAKVDVTQSCPTLCIPMDCSPQGSSSMEFSRQEYWNELPFPPPRDLPNLGINYYVLNL